jgi:hypothetical protein
MTLSFEPTAQCCPLCLAEVNDRNSAVLAEEKGEHFAAEERPDRGPVKPLPRPVHKDVYYDEEYRADCDKFPAIDASLSGSLLPALGWLAGLAVSPVRSEIVLSLAQQCGFFPGFSRNEQ